MCPQSAASAVCTAVQDLDERWRLDHRVTSRARLR